jgi:hypothetical protein
MLQNLSYMTGFQYQSLDMRNEAIDSILSDVVTKLLYLAPNYTFRADAAPAPRAMNSSLVKAEMLKKMIKKGKKETKTADPAFDPDISAEN